MIRAGTSCCHLWTMRSDHYYEVMSELDGESHSWCLALEAGFNVDLHLMSIVTFV